MTTTYIFDELVTFLNNRGRHDLAIQAGTRLLTSPSVNLVHVGENLFRSGWEYLVRHTDKSYSLTDCISFLTMREMGLQDALAFDAHFEQAGFRRLPTT